ncbi:MAG: hypothetical protein ACI8RD_014704 [Bacillariaceae sp.]|jgi:hypothetical protein
MQIMIMTRRTRRVSSTKNAIFLGTCGRITYMQYIIFQIDERHCNAPQRIEEYGNLGRDIVMTAAAAAAGTKSIGDQICFPRIH